MARNGFPVPGRGNPLNAAAADELQLPRGRCSTLRVEPRASGIRRLEDCYRGQQEKIVQLEGKKLLQKTVDCFT